MAKRKPEAPVEEAPKEAVETPEVSETVEAGEEKSVETKVDAKKQAKIDEIDALFEELEPKMLSGDTDRMNQQKAELLSVRIKIKRLI